MNQTNQTDPGPTVKLVHKDPPPLDLVGWYTLVPKTGPTPDHLPIHNQILKGYNESAVLLGFHTEDVLAPVAGDPLPLTIYESNLEAKDEGREGGHAASEDREMKDPDAAPQMVLRFRELPFTTETGDAEMIAMQFIREGGANATAQASQKPAAPASTPAQAPASGAKGKHRDAAAEASADSHNDVLSKEESEQISALQAKANAIKMMKSRLDLIITYLEKLPPGSVTGSGAAAAAAGTHQGVTLSNNILRQIRALVTNVELVTLSHQDTLQAEILQESNDVALIGLVKDLMTSINEVRDVGKKFFVAELNKTQRSRMGHFDGKGGPSFPVGSAMEFL